MGFGPFVPALSLGLGREVGGGSCWYLGMSTLLDGRGLGCGASGGGRVGVCSSQGEEQRVPWHRDWALLAGPVLHPGTAGELWG